MNHQKKILKKKTNRRYKIKADFLCSYVPTDTEVVLTHNKSGRFESRFVSVGIQESPSIWLKGMEGSALGAWVAHGEGTLW